MKIAMTPAAEKFIRRMLRFGGSPGCGFRLAVSPGGCSGLAADFSVENEPRAGEQIFEINGVKLFLPAESRLLLDGVTVDFAETMTESGFVFRDPRGNAPSCGTQPPVELVSLSAFGVRK